MQKKSVKLRVGTEVDKSLVYNVMPLLEALALNSEMILDLVTWAMYYPRLTLDKYFMVLFGDFGLAVDSRYLLPAVRDIILSAVDWTGEKINISSPLASQRPLRYALKKIADVQSYELYEKLQQIVEVIFETVNAYNTLGHRQIELHDRSKKLLRSDIDQTCQGFFLEILLGLPNIMTPWGYNELFVGGGSSDGAVQEWLPILNSRLKLTYVGASPANLLRYAIHQVDELVLPEPKLLEPIGYEYPEDVLKIWQGHCERYHAESLLIGKEAR